MLKGVGIHISDSVVRGGPVPVNVPGDTEETPNAIDFGAVEPQPEDSDHNCKAGSVYGNGGTPSRYLQSQSRQYPQDHGFPSNR